MNPHDAQSIGSTLNDVIVFLQNGGPSIWAITALSVLLLTVIIWKIWRFSIAGIWGISRKSRLTFKQDVSASLDRLQVEIAREEVTQIAQRRIAEANSGFRLLELIATIAPLLGLLGTVLGMIAAFQALQESGSGADPSVLAGGIWEALLTTAAGMAVAIPASVALTWFESVVDRLRLDFENIAVSAFVNHQGLGANLKVVT